MENVSELFGCDVFGDRAMKEYLSSDVYEKLKMTIKEGKRLDTEVANEVAEAMKKWAIGKGATHFTHWFQPMTGMTAEKHDSFLTPADDGTAIMEFSGKELIKGETDGSSFPSGGLRATFEARGYTAWDPTSYAFVKDGSLCVPTVFCSYGGEALDKKTPLLRSMDVLSKASMRLVKLMGDDDIKNIYATTGAEQEYFLIDKELHDLRPDLIFCGRTLFGAMPPKGQEMNDHYFGVIKPRVSEYMKELDLELWRKGIPSHTKHNEVAPAQHEMAPVFTSCNTATDNNQITMEIMKNVAEKHGLVCLLHEKPFKGVNGSGKHNNWSLQTDKGENLLKPGSTPSENIRFLLILSAVIKAVDVHQDLLRISVASAGNDYRLGGDEAPPVTVSMFIGDYLEEILRSIANSTDFAEPKKAVVNIGAKVLPKILKDNSDRNRTSPFAFTGNKFEFRMLGSSASIACTNVIMNTIVTDVFNEFCDVLEKAEDKKAAALAIIRDTYNNHKRIIFNGDGYSKEWEEEAERRGLLNWKTTADAMPHYTDKKNIELFSKYGIYSETELTSRRNILLDTYGKTTHVEGKTAYSMVKNSILPAVSDFTAKLCSNMNVKREAGMDGLDYEYMTALKLSEITDKLYLLADKLDEDLGKATEITDMKAQSEFYRDFVVADIEEIRALADKAETLTDKEYWPFPSYSDLLFDI